MLTDFRDTAVLPALALARGINPYDTSRYRTTFPYAQEFDPYAPWWLSITAPLHHLTWETSSAIGSVVLAMATSLMGFVIMRRVLDSRTSYSTRKIAIPAFGVWVLWMWRPTAIGQGLGNVGAVEALVSAACLAARRPKVQAALLALTWLKPQFALPIGVLLVIQGRWRPAVAGTLLAGFVSIPALVRLSSVSGGLENWMRSVLTSLTTLTDRTDREPLQGRVDLAGSLQRHSVGTGMLATVILLAIFLGVGGFFVHRMQQEHGMDAGLLLASTSILLALPHLHYDMAMVEPFLFTLLVRKSKALLRNPDQGNALKTLMLVVALTVGILPSQFLIGRFSIADVLCGWLLVVWLGCLVLLLGDGWNARHTPVPVATMRHALQ